MIKKSIQKVYLALIFILLYAPIVTLMVLSFNESRTRAKWGGFTLKWYQELFKNEQIMSAFYTTLVIAFLAAAAATVIGTAASIAIQGMKQRWRTMSVPDASFYRSPDDAGIRHDTYRPYYVQYSLCDTQRFSEAAPDKPPYI